MTKPLAAIHRSNEQHWVGDGFPVRSVFSYNDLGRELSPFLLLDYAAPYEFSPAVKTRGVGAHPHRGFETVTIVYQGELEHRDSSGGGGKIGPGDVQWMTAGSGIVHEEFHSHEFTRAGGTFHVIQLWVNLPAKHKSAPPAYQTLLSKDIPSVRHQGAEIRLISGNLNGVQGAAKSFTPINLWDVKLTPHQKTELPLRDNDTSALLVLDGEVKINGERTAAASDIAIFSSRVNAITLEASTPASLLVLNGEPLLEPIAGYGPFVMNTREEIARAYEDFRSGRMGSLPD